MKKFLVSLVLFGSLGLGTITASAASINGSWHAKSLSVKIHGNRAVVNGYHVRLKKTSYNHWKSAKTGELQPFTVNYSNGKLHFHSGMDNQILHR